MMRPNREKHRQLDQSSRLTPSQHVVAATQGGTTILLDPVAECYFSLTGIGGTIWSLLEDEPTIDELVARLAERFDVDQEQLSNDVKIFVASLLDSRLIGEH